MSYIMIVTFCRVLQLSPYLTDCTVIQRPFPTKQLCMEYIPKFAKKGPYWTSNPKAFKRKTAAPLREPVCIPDPYLDQQKLYGLK